ncbi:Pleckstrin y domain-containing H member 1 [Balamuthia mandrillaris]
MSFLTRKRSSSKIMQSPSDQRVLRSGYLLKRGKVNRAYRVRWFVLQDGRLSYYKTPSQTKALDYIPLQQAVIRIVTEDSILSGMNGGTTGGGTGGAFTAGSNNGSNNNSVGGSGNSGSGGSGGGGAGSKEEFHQFEIVISNRVYQLAARSLTDMVDWVGLLNQHTHITQENLLIEDAEEMICKATYFQAKLVDEKEKEEFRKSRKFGPGSIPALAAGGGFVGMDAATGGLEWMLRAGGAGGALVYDANKDKEGIPS